MGLREDLVGPGLAVLFQRPVEPRWLVLVPTPYEKVRSWYADVSQLLGLYPDVKERFDVQRVPLGPKGVFVGLGAVPREELRKSFTERARLLKELIDRLGTAPADT